MREISEYVKVESSKIVSKLAVKEDIYSFETDRQNKNIKIYVAFYNENDEVLRTEYYVLEDEDYTDFPNETHLWRAIDSKRNNG